jgi:hypothetical protein
MKLSIIIEPKVMDGPGLSRRANQRRDANQTQSPNSNCRKRVHSTLPFGASHGSVTASGPPGDLLKPVD